MKNVSQFLFACYLLVASVTISSGQNEYASESFKKERFLVDASCDYVFTSEHLANGMKKINNKSITGYASIYQLPILDAGNKENKILEKSNIACNATWSRKNSSKSKKYKVELLVDFEQHVEGDYIVTTCTIGHTYLKKKILGIFWVNATATSITLSGSFSGPRSPLDVNGNFGYLQSNPFSINYSSPVIHYKDYSYQNLPCYTMTHGAYTINANLSNGNISTTVGW